MNTTINIVQRPQICPGCGGKKWQVNRDGLKVTCPMCGGSGIFMPPAVPIFKSNITITSQPIDEADRSKPEPGWTFIPPPAVDDPRRPDTWPWWRHNYVGDFPRDCYPEVIC